MRSVKNYKPGERAPPCIYDVTSAEYKDAQKLCNVYGRALPEPFVYIQIRKALVGPLQ